MSHILKINFLFIFKIYFGGGRETASHIVLICYMTQDDPALNSEINPPASVSCARPASASQVQRLQACAIRADVGGAWGQLWNFKNARQALYLPSGIFNPVLFCEKEIWGWKDGSVVTSTCCSCRGQCSDQHPWHIQWLTTTCMYSSSGDLVPCPSWGTTTHNLFLKNE